MAKAQIAWWTILSFLLGVFFAGSGFEFWTGFVFVVLTAVFIFYKYRTAAAAFLVLAGFFSGFIYFAAYAHLGHTKLRPEAGQGYASGTRNRIIQPLKRLLPGEEAALLAGLTFGAKEDFTTKLKADMLRSGTTHLTAISGYNIQLITLTLFSRLLWIVRRRIAVLLTTAILILFVLMVGMQASVIRAAIMGLLMLFAAELGRAYSFDHALVWAAFLMVLFDPTILFSAGFTLSFASLLGIVYLGPAILKLLRQEDVPATSLRSIAAMTLAAQLAVVPVLLIQFGYFSAVSFFANMAILPLMPLTMFFGFMLAGIGLLAPALAYSVAWISHVLLAYDISIIHLSANIGGEVHAAGFSAMTAVFYYMVIIAIIFYSQGYERA